MKNNIPQFSNLGEINKLFADAMRPPSRMKVSEAATEFRYLREATHVGPWDNDIAPYLVEPMNEMESLEFGAEIFVGPARSGKSDMFFNWIGYAVNCDAGDILLVHMTTHSARDWSQSDLRKALRHSTKIGSQILPGRQSVNVHDVRFRNGTRLLIKWPSITELSGKTVRRVWFMDMDRMALNIDGEGSPFSLGRKRVQTYGRHGMAVGESSPGHQVEEKQFKLYTEHQAPPTKGILSIYNTGDRRRWYWRCASCGGPFRAEMDYMYIPNTPGLNKMERAEKTVVICPHCDFEHTHDPDPYSDPPQPGKNGLNRRGKWLKDGEVWNKDGTISGEAVQSDIASFWLQGVAAAFVSWRELAIKYLNALEKYDENQDESDLITVTNTDFGMPYISRSNKGELLPEKLKERADESLGEKVIPYGVRFTTASIDVQGNRYEVGIHGHDDQRNIYVIDRFSIWKSNRLDANGDPLPIDPKSYIEDWDVLIKEVIEKTYPLVDGSGRHMKIKAIACDSHGAKGVTHNAYRFWVKLRDENPSQHHLRFQLVRGDPHLKGARAVITYPDSERKDRMAGARGNVPVLQINSNLLKDEAFSLMTRNPVDGGLMLPAWLPLEYYQEMTAEVNVGGKGWENKKKLRNESWDLLVYALALTYTSRHGSMNMIDWLKPPGWAKEWDENDMVFFPDEGVPFSHKKKEQFDLAKLAKKYA